MEFLKSNDQPADLNDPVMLFAFSGWADAGEAATHGLRYLVRHLKGTKFAEIDPEEFYNFTRARPHTKFDDAGERYIKWPANEFFAVKHEGGGQDLVVFIGVEPNLRWRTFCESMLEVVRDLGVTKVIQVGALFDAVPHTRETRVTGTVGAPEQKSLLRGIEVRRSRYTGPTGISGVLADTLRRAGLPVISLWGHSPHYLQVSPNPKVSLRLLECLGQLEDIHLDVEPLRSQGANFERRVEQALSDEPEVIAYVEKLEAQWDSNRRRQRGGLTSGSEPGVDDMPDPGQAVEGIEEFLRQARQQEGDSTESRE
jgi:proteasome assembly chaperone (PAC2) family protein